jgi:hypothetical protein
MLATATPYGKKSSCLIIWNQHSDSGVVDETTRQQQQSKVSPRIGLEGGRARDDVPAIRWDDKKVDAVLDTDERLLSDTGNSASSHQVFGMICGSPRPTPHLRPPDGATFDRTDRRLPRDATAVAARALERRRNGRSFLRMRPAIQQRVGNGDTATNNEAFSALRRTTLISQKQRPWPKRINEFYTCEAREENDAPHVCQQTAIETAARTMLSPPLPQPKTTTTTTTTTVVFRSTCIGMVYGCATPL